MANSNPTLPGMPGNPGIVDLEVAVLEVRAAAGLGRHRGGGRQPRRQRLPHPPRPGADARPRAAAGRQRDAVAAADSHDRFCPDRLLEQAMLGADWRRAERITLLVPFGNEAAPSGWTCRRTSPGWLRDQLTDALGEPRQKPRRPVRLRRGRWTTGRGTLMQGNSIEDVVAGKAIRTDDPGRVFVVEPAAQVAWIEVGERARDRRADRGRAGRRHARPRHTPAHRRARDRAAQARADLGPPPAGGGAQARLEEDPGRGLRRQHAVHMADAMELVENLSAPS